MTDEQIATFTQMHMRGDTYRQIAKYFGWKTPGTVGYWVRKLGLPLRDKNERTCERLARDRIARLRRFGNRSKYLW